MRSCVYIYFCGLVLGCQLQLITTQSEEPYSTESLTESIWNETELNTTGTPYEVSFTEQNELIFGMPYGNKEEPSFNSSSDSNETTSTTLRIKAPGIDSVTEYSYSYNELDYKLPASYNYDYGSLIGFPKNSSASNRTVIPPLTSHIEPVIPYVLGNVYSGPQFQNPAMVAPVNGGSGIAYHYVRSPMDAFKKDLPRSATNTTLIIPPMASPFGGIQLRHRSLPGRTVMNSASTVAVRSSTVPTKSFRTKMSFTKSVTVTKKKTQTTRRPKKQTSSTTTTSKRFRAVEQQNVPVKSVHSKPTVTRKLRTRTRAVRAKQFRSVRRTRTPRRRKPSKLRRFRNQRRTKPTIRKRPIARPWFRHVTRRPRAFPPPVFDYDFIYS